MSPPFIPPARLSAAFFWFCLYPAHAAVPRMDPRMPTKMNIRPIFGEHL